MTEEGVIFGAKRHLYGGIEPDNMRLFSATRTSTNDKITAQIPSDTVIDNKLLCTVKGAVIRRKEGAYPENEFDGELVGEISDSSVHTFTKPHNSLSYYYAAFPYSAQNVFNRNKTNRTRPVTSSTPYRFGFTIQIH